jgi:hypothetical protein
MVVPLLSLRGRHRRAGAHRSPVALLPLPIFHRRVGPACQQARVGGRRGPRVEWAGPVVGLGFRFLFSFYYFHRSECHFVNFISQNW